MIRICAAISLAIASAGVLRAQVQLPELYIYNYTMTQRDPFISPEAPHTLLTQNKEMRGVVSGDTVKRYLERIIQIGDTPLQSIALINGIDFHVGDKIPLETTRKELQGIQQLAASYGLPAVTDEKGSLVLEIGRVTESGVDLVLPGFKAAIYQLPLVRDIPSASIQLEKRKKRPRPNI